jgi:hypothetical protein
MTKSTALGEGGSISYVDYDVRDDNVVNVPLQLGVSADRKLAGLGLDIVANLNEAVPDFGVVLTVSLGKMR